MQTDNKNPDQLKNHLTDQDHSSASKQYPDTLQPLYNMVRYNTVLDIAGFKDGSQKCIDYIEK